LAEIAAKTTDGAAGGLLTAGVRWTRAFRNGGGNPHRKVLYI